MAVTVSTVLLLGAVLVLLIRKSGLKVMHAIVAGLFGFYVAGTSVAPQIREGTATLAGMLSGIGR